MAMKDKIIEFTIDKFEGHLSNDSADRGGLTSYGITRPFLAWYHHVKPEAINPQELTGMTKQEAMTIYAWAYDQYKVGLLPDDIQHIYWDMCVNHGVGNAVKIMQRAVTVLGFNIGAIDGQLGFNTNKALHDADAKDHNALIRSIVFNRISFYKKIVINDPSQERFLQGWINRANWFLTNRL